jgi:hypothetical protein
MPGHQGFSVARSISSSSPVNGATAAVGATAEPLADRVGPQAAPDTVERISDLCAGNPLLLEQAALALRRGRTSSPRPARLTA